MEFTFAFRRIIERAQESLKLHVYLVYFSILLDNLLLTVVVPVIPDVLVKLDEEEALQESFDSSNNNSIFRNVHIDWENKSQELNNVENRIESDHSLTMNGRSLAWIHQLHPSLNTENGQIGTILSSKAFVQLIFNPFVSLIINRLGYELTLILGVSILLQSSMMYYYGNSFAMLLLPRALQGIGSALINISGMSMIANLFRDKETRMLHIGTSLSGMASGVLIGYPLGGFLYHWFNKEVLFGSIIMALILLLGVQLLSLNWSPTNAPSHFDSKTLNIMMNPILLMTVLIIGISTVTMSLLESFLPLWLISSIHPENWQLGVVFIPDSVGYLLGTKLFSLLSFARHHREIILTLALLSISASAYLVPLIPSLFWLSIPHFGIGLGIGTVDSALFPLLAELVDSELAAQYGYVYAAAQTASSGAYAFGPLFGGAFLRNQWLTFRSLMHFIALCNLILALLSMRIRQMFTAFCVEKTEMVCQYETFNE